MEGRRVVGRWTRQLLNHTPATQGETNDKLRSREVVVDDHELEGVEVLDGVGEELAQDGFLPVGSAMHLHVWETDSLEHPCELIDRYEVNILTERS
jgi:hypothetical protein